MPSAPSHPTIVQIVHLDETGDSLHRMRWPAQALAAQQPEWKILNVAYNHRDRYEWALAADLLVLYQCQDLDFLPVLQKRREKNFKTLVEYNDNFCSPQPWSPVATHWQSPLLWQSYEVFMKAADGLLVTGPGLQELFTSKTNIPIHILKNHYPHTLTSWSETPASVRNPSERVVIGWAGSLGHMADLLSLKPLFEHWLEKFPQVDIAVMGNESIPSLLRLPTDRFRFKQWGSMEDYFEFWSTIDIGLAPLHPTPYNRCRSDIKAVEIASQGALPIVQNDLPYLEFLSETKLSSFTDFAELNQIVERYLADPQKITDDRKRAYEYVRSQRRYDLRQERSDLYSQSLPTVLNSQSATWPTALGYHQVTAPTEDQTATARFLQNIQKSWNENKDRENCIAQLSAAVSASPQHPELATALMRALAALGRPADALTIADDAATRFPADIRFDLARLTFLTALSTALLTGLGTAASNQPHANLASSVSYPQDVANALHTIAEKLKTWGPQSQDLIRVELADALAKSLRLNVAKAADAEVVSQALSHRDLRICFEIAEAYEREKQDGRALPFYQRCLDGKNAFEANAKALESLDRGYLAAWVATLKSRTCEPGVF